MDSLSKEQLEIIFDKETEALYVDENHDMSLLKLCSKALSKYDGNELAEFIKKKYDIRELEKNYLSQRQNNDKAARKRRIPVRNKINIAVAAAIAICILSISVFAVFDPFARYGFSVNELIGFKGNEVTGDSYQLNVAKNITYFNSPHELSEYVRVLMPGENANCKINKISLTEYDNYNSVYINLTLSNNTLIDYTVYYGNSIPEGLDEKYYADNSAYTVLTWRGYNMYNIDLGNTQQINIYVGEYVYVFSAEKAEDIILLLDDLN